MPSTAPDAEVARWLVLASETGSIPRAAHFAEACARESRFPDEVVDRLMLAASEAAANALTHGNRLDPTRHVVLTWAVGEEGGWFGVEDEGRGLDAARLDAPELPADPLDTGGRGLYIMKALSDHVRVSEGGRRVELYFKRAPR